MLRASIGWSAADADLREFRLWDDNGNTDDYTLQSWTEILATATTVVLQYSADAGLTWKSINLNIDWLGRHPRIVARINRQIADGVTEYVVRFVIDGVTSDAFVVRFER